MLEGIIEVIIYIFMDLIGQTFLELLIELSKRFMKNKKYMSIGEKNRRSKSFHPVLEYAGIIVLGLLIGYASVLIFPNRIIFFVLFSGISLILSPLFAGIIMHLFGKWREKNGYNKSRLATFLGGALFAFSFAIIRWLSILLNK